VGLKAEIECGSENRGAVLVKRHDREAIVLRKRKGEKVCVKSYDQYAETRCFLRESNYKCFAGSKRTSGLSAEGWRKGDLGGDKGLEGNAWIFRGGGGRGLVAAGGVSLGIQPRG